DVGDELGDGIQPRAVIEMPGLSLALIRLVGLGEALAGLSLVLPAVALHCDLSQRQDCPIFLEEIMALPQEPTTWVRWSDGRRMAFMTPCVAVTKYYSFVQPCGTSDPRPDP